MYSFASRSQRYAPMPRTMVGGSPPTDLNARTGEFTPPGMTRSARSWAAWESSVLRDMALILMRASCERRQLEGTLLTFPTMSGQRCMIRKDFLSAELLKPALLIL